MKLWGYTWRELWRRPGRTLLTLLGIIIGVAAVVAVSMATSTASQAFEDMFAAVGGRASLEVVAVTQGPFDPALAGDIGEVEGVEAAVPGVQEQAAMLGGASRAAMLVMGVDPALGTQVHEYSIEAGSALEADGGGVSTGVPVLLEGAFARSQGLSVGDAVELVTRVGSTDAVVQGLLAPGGISAFNGGAVLLLRLADAQRLYGYGSSVNTIQIVVEDGRDREAVQAAIGDILPAGLMVQTPGSRGDLAEVSLAPTQAGLSAVSALALVAGGFIITNSFLMNVGERRRQLALLRALGATRRQVTRLLVREAVLLGVVGTVIGLAAGLAAAQVLGVAIGQLLGVELPSLQVSARPFVLAAVLGPGLALAATYIPARRAARVAPLEGLVAEGREETRGGRRRVGYAGVALAALSTLAGIGLTVGVVGLAYANVIFAGLLIGCVMAIPLVVGPLSRMWSRVLVPLLRSEGRLAFRQIDRHRTRTSLTVGVLFVAITVAIAMGNSLLSNVRDTADWYERTLVGDFFVRGVLPDMATTRAVAMPEELGGEIVAIPGVERADPVRFLPGTAGGRQVIVLARPFAPERQVPVDLEEGDPGSVVAGVNEGGVIIGTGLAMRAGIEVGDTITVETTEGPRDFPVVGTTTEYTAGGDALYMSWDVAKQHLGFDGVDVFMVTAQEGQAGAVEGRLRALTDDRGLILQTMADFRAYIDGLINGVLGILWLLVAMIFVVASLGIINTLTMNVIEQTRELGLLRAVAMTRGQVRKMIVSQALAVGAISLVPGAVVGVAVAYLLNRGSNATSGGQVDFRVEPALVVGSFVVALVIAVVAAYLPARRAARLQVVEALQYE